MQGLGEFFKRIQNVYTRQILIRTEIQKVITKHTGAEVPITAMFLKNGVVSLKNISQSHRSVIFIKKTAIIEELGQNQSIPSVTDIR